MKTFNFAKLAHAPAPAGEVERLLNNLDSLARKHAAGLCVRHVATTAAFAAAHRAHSGAAHRSNGNFASVA